MQNRRTFIGSAAGAVTGLAAGRGGAGTIPAATFTAAYDVDRSVLNFDAAYYGAMTRTTQAVYRSHGDWVNRHNALFLRSALPGPSRDERLQPATDAVATLIGARADEIALCGGGTEALYALIANYRRLNTGDAVAMADIDYDEMQHAMGYLEATCGVRLVRFTVPEPSTAANILAAYDRLLRDTPRLKLLLLTQLSNRNGLILPVREIVALARTRGVDVILDAAQSVGHMPVDVDDLGVDFMGFSLHKWIAAPLGTGAIYIRRSRLADVAPWLGNHIRDEDDVRARIPTGTADIAARLTVPHAIAEHQALDPRRKLEHLIALRDRWVGQVRDVPGLTIVQPDEPGRYAAIGAFRLPGQRDWAQAQAAQKRFLDRHRMLVVAKQGLASGPVLRVTPAIFTTTDELDRLAAAIRAERGLFV